MNGIAGVTKLGQDYSVAVHGNMPMSPTEPNKYEKSMKRPELWPFLGASAIACCMASAALAQAGQTPASRAPGELRFQFTQPGYASSQSSARQVNSRGREISDQDYAQDKRDRREVLPLDVLLSKAQREGRGEFLGVEPDVSSNLYRFKFMRPDGKVVWVDVDARSGAVRSVRK